MGEIDGIGELSCPGYRAMVRVRFSLRWMGTIGLHLEFTSRSDVRARVTLIFRFMVRQG